MKTDWSAPVVNLKTPFKGAQRAKKTDEDDKQVDYSHLDIVSEIEHLTGCSLRHVSKSEYSGRCPFPGCPSLNDGFRVWDRATLDETRDGKREKHFWCRRCDRSGDLVALIRQYKEAMTGEILSWAEAARSLGIDSRTWRAFAEGDQQPHKASTSSSSEKRRQQEAQREKDGQTELDLLGAWYVRARGWLGAGQIAPKDGRIIPLDQARLYLQERGFSLEQANLLGLAYMPTVKELPELATIPEAAILAPWRGRLLFPLSGPKGTTGYAGRSLLGWKVGMSATEHKQQLNAWNEHHPEKPVVRYRKTYQTAHYGYEDACSARTLMIVEGEFDAASIRLALDGIEDIAVMAVGTHFQARLVPLKVAHVILALDGDAAGQQALARQKEDLEGCGIVVEVARPPVGKDWNDCLILSGLPAIRTAMLACTQDVWSKPSSENAHDRPVPDTQSPVPCTDLNEQNMNAQNERDMSDSSSPADQPRNEPPNYENGDICLSCGVQFKWKEGAFHAIDDKASDLWGEMFCITCWEAGSIEPCGKYRSTTAQNERSEFVESSEEEREQVRKAAFIKQMKGLEELFEGGCSITLLPKGMSSADYIERWYQGERPGEVITSGNTGEASTLVSESSDQGDFSAASNRCKKHGKPLAHSDEQGGRYCSHVDCWERYRLIRAGAALGYPALAGIIDQRDYLADITKAPLYHTSEGWAIYPTRPAISKQLIDAGADAWRDYVAGQKYHQIDQAVKAALAI